MAQPVPSLSAPTLLAKLRDIDPKNPSTDDVVDHFDAAGCKSKVTRETITAKASIILPNRQLIADLLEETNNAGFQQAIQHEAKRAKKAAIMCSIEQQTIDLLRELEHAENSAAAQEKLCEIAETHSSEKIVEWTKDMLEMSEKGTNKLFTEILNIIKKYGIHFKEHLPDKKTACRFYKTGWNTKAANRSSVYKLYLSWFQENCSSVSDEQFWWNLRKYIQLDGVFPTNSFMTQDAQSALIELGISMEDVKRIANKKKVQICDIVTYIDTKLMDCEVVESENHENDVELPAVFGSVPPTLPIPMNVGETNATNALESYPMIVDDSTTTQSENLSYHSNDFVGSVPPLAGMDFGATEPLAPPRLVPQSRKRVESFGQPMPKKRRRVSNCGTEIANQPLEYLFDQQQALIAPSQSYMEMLWNEIRKLQTENRRLKRIIQEMSRQQEYMSSVSTLFGTENRSFGNGSGWITGGMPTVDTSQFGVQPSFHGFRFDNAGFDPA